LSARQAQVLAFPLSAASPGAPVPRPGGSGHGVGPRGAAAAQAFHGGVGMPGRKVPAVLPAWTGGQLTQGAITPDALRRAAGTLGPGAAPWRAAIAEAPVGHPADTGWRVGGAPAHLRAFETAAAPVEQIRPRQRHAAVPEVIPADSAGVLVTARGRSDAAHTFDHVDQHTCRAHIWRSISAVVARQTGRARAVGAQLTAWVPAALGLWHRQREDPGADGTVEAAALQAERTSRRRDRRLQDRDHPRLRHVRGWPHDRGHGLRLLTEPRIAPPNQRAARALRPAVIARTVAHGSQHDAGAHACAALTRVVRTLANQGMDAPVEHLYQWFRCSDVHQARQHILALTHFW
jgi:transposase